jgi:exodeoxyribonuclease V beta subunit
LKNFDILNSPLSGTNLIEASAGTGKTYNIEGLFVRLIVEKQLLVDQILVVTFTNAATEELKDRIRSKLLEAKNAFVAGISEDQFLNALVANHDDPRTAIQILHDALINFDTAAIYTIHGFCQRLLTENAFETGSRFNTELVTDQADILQEVVDDFWRKHFYDAPIELVNYAVPKLEGPYKFAGILSSIKTSEARVIPSLSEPSLKNLKAFQKALRQLKHTWPDARETVIQALESPALDGRQYGTMKPHPSHPDMTKRDYKIQMLAESMNQCLNSPGGGFPLFVDFKYFTTGFLAQKTKKNQTAPQHAFFDLCDEIYGCAEALKADFDKYILYLKTQIFRFKDTELPKRKAKKNIIFFDDLLQQVKKALEGSEGRALVKTVHDKFKAALVDEFQDTDNVQYEIFTRLFSSKNHLLFMIGDPKQAIYGFRGADIFSYMKASRSAESKFTLTKNWRSDPGLITAVNTIFSNVKQPFLFDAIPFTKGSPGKSDGSKTEKSPASMTIWHLTSDRFYKEEMLINKKEAIPCIAAAVAEEILDLISPGAASIAPEDIAVLVRTNKQARIIKDCLSGKAIPAVLHSTGSVFESHEALELETILTAISEPGHVAYLKAALVMDALGVNGQQLITAEQNQTWWERQLSQFQEYYRIWETRGFIQMFRVFSETAHLKERLLAFADGERRLTNMLHLAEILHQVSTEKRLGTTALIKWLADQRGSATGEQRKSSIAEIDAHQLRLESDARAVRIVTVHRSKGLEYPVVFCPFAWESKDVNSSEVVFHDSDQDSQLTLDLGSQAQMDHLVLSQNERLAEYLRLFYVALTRAKKRCYFVWGKIKSADASALAYLLYASNLKQRPDDPDGNITKALKEYVTERTESDILSDLKSLASRSKGSIRVLPVPLSSDRTFHPEQAEADHLACRKFQGKIDRSWKISSYSSLVSVRTTDIDLPDHDVYPTISGRVYDLLSQKSESADGTGFSDIFSFPKGSRTGIFFHDIFEHIDFKDPLDKGIRNLVEQKLDAYGFDQQWLPTVCNTIAGVLNAPLPPGGNEFTLQDIGISDRINEMEFYFPLNRVGPRIIREIFKNEAGITLEADYSTQLEKLTFAPAAGFMKGFIDLIFEHDGKFYLVDWKSNYLGPTFESYKDDSLVKSMHEHLYTLQYHLYTLALYQYLRQHKPDFNYSSDFGGVFYIFLRGAGDPQNPANGVYQGYPSFEMIERMGLALIPDF